MSKHLRVIFHNCPLHQHIVAPAHCILCQSSPGGATWCVAIQRPAQVRSQLRFPPMWLALISASNFHLFSTIGVELVDVVSWIPTTKLWELQSFDRVDSFSPRCSRPHGSVATLRSTYRKLDAWLVGLVRRFVDIENDIMQMPQIE